MKTLKSPWLAALLALVLGGPGCFYLGWRRGLKATVPWLLLVSLFVGIQFYPDASRLELEFLFLILLQAGLAWMAYRSCKRTNAEAAKAAASAASGTARRVPADGSNEVRKLGLEVIVLSGIALFGSAMTFANSIPPMGELGHFTHDSCLLMIPVSAWGVATGIGLRRAWRWARISMLVFGGLLAIVGTLLTLPMLFMPGGGMVWWAVLALRVFGVLLFLTPAVIGARWFGFFMRSNVKAYFGVPRKSPPAPA